MRKYTLTNIFSRDDFNKHPILNQISEVFNAIEKVRKIRVSPKKIYKLLIVPIGEKEIFNDPISFFLRDILTFKSNKNKPYRVFFSLEMFEFQVNAVSIKQKIRNKIFQFCHFYALKRAEKVLFSNKLRRGFYLNQIIGLQARSVVLPNLPDKKSIISLASTPTEDEISHIIMAAGCLVPHELSQKIIFLYAGALRDDNISLQKLILNISGNTKHLILLCGKVSGEQSEIFSLSNVIHLGELPRAHVLKLIAFSAIGLAHYGTTPLNVHYAAPVKIFEYLAGGLVVLCNKNKGVQALSDPCIYYYNEDGLVDNVGTYELYKLLDDSRPRTIIPSFDQVLMKKLQE